MADHTTPDYELEETLTVDQPVQLRALFEETRRSIIQLLLERAATITELAETMDMPKGTMGHHVGVLADAGLIRVVRTKKVRAIEAKYYGRTARTFMINFRDRDLGIAPDHFLVTAEEEFVVASAAYRDDEDSPIMSTLRYARIPDDRAAEWLIRLGELTQEFASETRGGDTTYAMLAAFYPTEYPHLPDEGETQ